MKNEIAIVLGLAGFLVGCVGAWAGFSARAQDKVFDDELDVFRDVAEANGEMVATLGERLATLEAPLGRGEDGSVVNPLDEIARVRRDLQELNRAMNSLREDMKDVHSRYGGMTGRVDEAVESLRRLEKRVESVETTLKTRPWQPGGEPEKLEPPK